MIGHTLPKLVTKSSLNTEIKDIDEQKRTGKIQLFKIAQPRKPCDGIGLIEIIIQERKILTV